MAQIEDYERKQIVINVLRKLQARFYIKFKNPTDAHKFFDVNQVRLGPLPRGHSEISLLSHSGCLQDGDIDQGEFDDILKYAGCWHGPELAKDLFAALDADGSGDLSVREFTDRLLCPDEEGEAQMAEKLDLDKFKHKKVRVKKARVVPTAAQPTESHRADPPVLFALFAGDD